MQHFLNPVHGVRDAQVRAGLTPTNHHRNNVLAMKEQSRMNALRKQQEAQADATPAWKRTPSGKGPAAAAAAARRCCSAQQPLPPLAASLFLPTATAR